MCLYEWKHTYLNLKSQHSHVRSIQYLFWHHLLMEQELMKNARHVPSDSQWNQQVLTTPFQEQPLSHKSLKKITQTKAPQENPQPQLTRAHRGREDWTDNQGACLAPTQLFMCNSLGLSPGLGTSDRLTGLCFWALGLKTQTTTPSWEPSVQMLEPTQETSYSNQRKPIKLCLIERFLNLKAFF